MKTKITFIILSIFFIQCTSEVKKDKEVKTNKKLISQQKYPNKCNSNIPIKKTVDSKNKKLTFLGLMYSDINLYKNNQDNTYLVKDNSGKIRLKELHYFSRISGGFQALNKANEIIYYNLKLKKTPKHPKPEFLGLCGNVACWKLRIKDMTTYYRVEKLSGYSRSYKADEKWKMIDSITKQNGITDVNFLYKTKTMENDENRYLSEIIIINYKNATGIRKDKKTFTFDSIDSSKLPIKVKCKGDFGYFGITEIKYKKLDAFVYNLALFELDNGKKGYIDNTGNEYLIN